MLYICLQVFSFSNLNQKGCKKKFESALIEMRFSALKGHKILFLKLKIDSLRTRSNRHK